VAVMIQNSLLEESEKIFLMESLAWNTELCTLPGGLLELGRCYEELQDTEKAELFHLNSVFSSKQWCYDSNVYPYTELSRYFLKRNLFLHSLASFVKGTEILSSYQYTTFDSDLRVELTENINETFSKNFLQAITDSKNKSDYYVLLILIFDNLFFWFESTNRLFPMDWEKIFKKAIGLFSMEQFQISLTNSQLTSCDFWFAKFINLDRIQEKPLFIATDSTKMNAIPTFSITSETTECLDSVANEPFSKKRKIDNDTSFPSKFIDSKYSLRSKAMLRLSDTIHKNSSVTPLKLQKLVYNILLEIREITFK
jgi:hypothetical protein